MTAARASAASPAGPGAGPGAGLTAEDLLRLWELGLHAARLTREDALLQASGETPPPRALGARNAGLLAAHARWFGPALSLQSRCPACGEVIEYCVDSGAMAQSLRRSPPTREPALLTLGSHHLRLRAPDADDLAQAEAAGDGQFEATLLATCVLPQQDEADEPADRSTHATAAAAVTAWSEEVRAAALARIEALDPAASVGFDLQCPACNTAWLAPLDPGAVLWRKLQTGAERMLQEIDLLARAYGWREPDILALSPLRRAAYLQLVQA